MRNLLNKRLPISPLCHVTTIKQQITGSRQVASQFSQLRLVIQKGVAVQRGGAKRERPGGAMRKNMDGIYTAPPVKDGIHLSNGITLRIKNMNLDTWFNSPDQCLQIRQVPHEKGNFIPWLTANRGKILINSG